jgi:thiol-disulfide isomerase/thioredoxin
MTRTPLRWTVSDDLSNDRVRVVVKSDGMPVPGALVGTFARWCDTDGGSPGRQNGLTIYAGNRKRPIRTDATGTATIDRKHLFYRGWPQYREQSLFIIHSDRRIGALLKVKPENLGSQVDLPLSPLCHITGTVGSRELTGLGRSLSWTNVYAYWGKTRPAACDSTHGRFELLLPTGSYTINAYGTETYDVKKNIRIRQGQKSAAVDLDLPAHRLAYLFGKPAPELRKIKEWKNGPARISDLIGKVVLLDFWGYWCGPCVHSMPALMELHDKFANQGLVVIAVHDDTVESVADLAAKCADARNEIWNGRDLPFPVAIDGGGKCKVPRRKAFARGTMTALYGINSFPTTLLIDKHGILAEQVYPSANEWVEKRIRELLDA